MRTLGFMGSALLIILLAGAGCSGSVGTMEQTSLDKNYTNQENFFSIDYPSDWMLKEGVAGTVAAFVSPRSVEDPFADNITVVVRPTQANVHDYVASAVKSAPASYDDFKLLDNKPTTLSETDGEMVTYTFTEGELKPYTREIFAVRDGRVYDITFTASQEDPDQLWDTAETIINSFKITK